MGIFGFGASYKPVSEEKSFAMKEIHEIQVTISSAPVHIIRTKAGSELKFHYHGKAMQELKLEAERNQQTVVVGVKRKYETLPIPEDMFLDIYIPEDYGKNLSLKTSSGKVKMDSLELENFTLNTSSGGLEAEQLNAQKTSITTSSGELSIKKIDTKELELKGSSSAINVDECIVKNAEMALTSGSITLKNSSGNFDFNGTAGSVLISYKKFENQNVSIATTTGSVTLELPGSAEFMVEAKTTTGNIQSDFAIPSAGNIDKKQVVGQIGTKNNKVSLKTTTGSIHIVKKQ